MLYQLLERSEQFITEKMARNQTLELKKYILVYSEEITEFHNTVKRLKKSDKGLKEITKIMINRPNVVKREEIELMPCTDKDRIALMKG